MFLFCMMSPRVGTGILRMLALCFLITAAADAIGPHVTAANAQSNRDTFEQLQIEAEVQADGSLMVSETRRYKLNFFRSHFPADLFHGGRQLEVMDVVLNGEPIEAFRTLPEYASNPAAEEPGPGYFVQQQPDRLTLLIFGRFGETEVRIRYRLSGAVQQAGEFAYLNHIFANGGELNMAEGQARPSVGGLAISLSLGFETEPAEVPFARLFTENDGEPLQLLTERTGETRITLPPVNLRFARPVHLRALFSGDTVPDLPGTAGRSAVSVQSLEAEYEAWVARTAERQLREQGLEQKRGFARPLGWVMLLLSLFTIIARRSRKRKRNKQVKELDFNQPLTMADIRRLPVGVMKTLYSAEVLQPRNRVHRLTGLALIDLARQGHLSISISIPPGYLTDRTITSMLGNSALRKMLPFQIKQLIERSKIEILPLEDKPDENLRPWHKLLLAYVRSRSGGKAIEFKTLFPTKTKLKLLQDSGAAGKKEADEIRAALKMLGEKVRESYFEDLEDGFSFYEEKRNPVYICLIALLVAVYLMAIESFMGLFLFLFAAPALIFAVLNRYELSAEGLRYSKFIRDHINSLRKNVSPAEETASASDLLADFMVLNWPLNYNELHSKPYYPIFAASPEQKNLVLTKLKNISLGPDLNTDPDKVLHFTNFIMQDTALRSFKQYTDFKGSELKLRKNEPAGPDKAKDGI